MVSGSVLNAALPIGVFASKRIAMLAEKWLSMLDFRPI
jgi:hypothetical protein